MLPALSLVLLTGAAEAPPAATGRPFAQVLGRSWEGRPIELLRAGDTSSSKRVLVVGCTHGDECAGMSVTAHVVRNGGGAAADLWLIPNLNPDGLARKTRANARGVDLNRDFDSFSQRETRVARNLIERIKPDVTIWFHQPQALVRGWGASRATARRYARLAGEPYRTLAWPRGAATRWQNGFGQISFVVELPPGPLPAEAVERHARAVLRLSE